MHIQCNIAYNNNRGRGTPLPHLRTRGEIKMLKLQKQPNGKTCGQTVVAMVSGIPVEESIKYFGHNKASNFKEQWKVFDKIGIKYGEHQAIDNRRKWELPSFAVVRIVATTRRMGHVLAYKDGVFYDPLGHIFNSREEVKEHYATRTGRKWRFSHYYEIKN